MSGLNQQTRARLREKEKLKASTRKSHEGKIKESEIFQTAGNINFLL